MNTLDWRDAGHLYAALVGFSVGAWAYTTFAFIVEIRRTYIDRQRLWRLPLGLACLITALSIYAAAVATALNNPRSDIPVWRLTLYWIALALADVGIVMMAWHVRRHSIRPLVSGQLADSTRSGHEG